MRIGRAEEILRHLWLAEGPLTTKRIEAELNIPTASAHTALRRMLTSGLVSKTGGEKVQVPGFGGFSPTRPHHVQKPASWSLTEEGLRRAEALREEAQ
ncbi:hypothetical protein [Actinocorallia libanotica]|uniref:MarR family transcriptional regulator n=1 Tax=Actinocorallia libanotica TaxID=46162 RepID=A0ABN1Q0S2_9ACTN